MMGRHSTQQQMTVNVYERMTNEANLFMSIYMYSGRGVVIVVNDIFLCKKLMSMFLLISPNLGITFGHFIHKAHLISHRL